MPFPENRYKKLFALTLISKSERSFKSFALLITVLLAVAVASIALIIVRLVISSSSAATETLLQDSTRSVVNSVRDSIYNQISEDPSLAYRMVLQSEFPRQCSIGEETATYVEGDDWPLECGSVWTYDTSTQNQGAKITLPSVNSPFLTVESTASLDTYTFGVTDAYSMGGLSKPSVYAGNDLDFNSINAAGISGNAYSVKAITPFLSSFQDTLLAAEEGWTVPPYLTSPGNPLDITYLGPDYIIGESGSPTIFPIRSGYPDPLLTSSFEESLDYIKEISCGSNFSSRNINVNLTNYSSNLCILPGYSLMNTTGNLVQVPEAAAILLLPGPSGNIIDIYYVDSLNLPGESCTSSCNLLEISEELIDASDHPGVLEYWTKLGSFYLPYSSFGYSDFTTFIGLCGEAFLGVSGTCSSFVSGIDLNLAVGTSSSRKSVFFSGPVINTTGHLSLLASGNFRVPFWASPPSTILEIQSSLASDSSSPIVESFPNVTIDDSDRPPSLFTLRGALAGKNLTINYSPSIHSIFATLIESDKATLLPTPTFEFTLVNSEIFSSNS